MKYLLLLLFVSIPIVFHRNSASSFLSGQEKTNGKAIPQFRIQEIATDLKVGYAVLLVDIDSDGKKDIVVVDTTRVVWYQNPTWKMRTIIQGQTAPDNVCIDAFDIDRDGQIDLALGAGWKPANTKTPGTLQWLKRGKTLDEQWTLYPIVTDLPTIHRIRFVDLPHFTSNELLPAMVVAPLHGRNATQSKNWSDGDPVNLAAYIIPKDPARDRWEKIVIGDHALHVLHGFSPVSDPKSQNPIVSPQILCASYEGVTQLSWYTFGGIPLWKATRLADGNQENPKGSRGSSEVKMGRLKNGKNVIATIEPWHGNQVVVYTESNKDGEKWVRHVIDEKLKWGHAVSFADLDGDGDEELIVGIRDDLSKNPGERRGVRIYSVADGEGAKWTRHDLDAGGVAVEDLAVADLNGDGRPDIAAVGRQTGNVRIYWNEK